MCTLAHERSLQTSRKVSKDKPILAYKQFHPKVVNGVIRFTPIFSSNYPTEGWERYRAYEAHSIPTLRNTYVGFHAIKRPSLQLLRSENRYYTLPVKLWGRVIEHRGVTRRSYPWRAGHPAGYRAQFMEIL